MREVDIERNEADDLLQQKLWREIWEELRQGMYDVVIVTPPCNSFFTCKVQCPCNTGPSPCAQRLPSMVFSMARREQQTVGRGPQLSPDSMFQYNGCLH